MSLQPSVNGYKQQQYIAPTVQSSLNPQVTSRGCSRAFMVCIFYRAFHWAVDMYENKKPFQWPYAHKAIDAWIKDAQTDMSQRPDWDKT